MQSLPRSCRSTGRLGRLLLAALFAALCLITSLGQASAQPFADTAFAQLWTNTDQAVATGQLQASWLWGPAPQATLNEAYQQAPGGQRLVEYFDKGRLEINNPAGDRNSPWFVSSGRLCSELVTGQLQTGDNSFEQHAPANVPVAGDLDSPVGPTYATFNRLGQGRAPTLSGYVVRSLDRNGQIGVTTGFDHAARYSYYEPTLGHNIPDVFMNWMNGLGSRGVSWQYLVGLPISEPYWATFRVGGTDRLVLVQLFERRALTYNPLNSAAWQVEMANIGLHYWSWRYNTAWGSVPAVGNEEQSYLTLLNQYRAAHGLSQLHINATLTNTAHWMSQDMASHHYFSHTDSTGRDPFKRMADFGYPTDTYRGENLAAGYETSAAVMEGWKNSPEHNANMLNPNYNVIGISRVYDANAPYHWYWTTEFGSR